MFVTLASASLTAAASARGYTPGAVLGKFQSENEARACAAGHFFFAGPCVVEKWPDEWAVEHTDGGPWRLYDVYGTGELAGAAVRHLRRHGNTVRMLPATDSPAAMAARREYNDGMAWELIGRHPLTGPAAAELRAMSELEAAAAK